MLDCESDVEFPEVVFHDSWTGRLLFQLLERGKARLNSTVNQQKVHDLCIKALNSRNAGSRSRHFQPTDRNFYCDKNQLEAHRC
jgi:hypothetical protein